jgi:MFS family permease
VLEPPPNTEQHNVHAGPPRETTGARLLATSIVLAALALRVWNIDAGIPHALGQDEPQIMERAVAMMKSGDFHPRFFDWPSLTIYLHLIVGAFTFLAGAMQGRWDGLDQITAADLYLTGRYFTAVLGAATVALTFAAGRRWGTRPALLAAALMAVIPYHVRESHYVLTDVPVAFFTTLSLLLTLRALERPQWSAFAWAAVAAGLAGSCKYNGLMAVVMPLVAAWFAGGGLVSAIRRTCLILAAALGAFLVGTPYAVLDLPFFLNDYADLAFTFAGPRHDAVGWHIYLKHLLATFDWPAFLAVLAGVGLALWRVLTGPRRAATACALAFAFIYFAVMAGSYQIYGRYLLPLLPIASLLAAAAVTAAVRMIQRRITSPRAGILAGGLLVVVVLAGPVRNGVGFSRELGRPTTVDAAYTWILENVPAGATVAVEAGAMGLPQRYRVMIVTQFTQRARAEYDAEGVRYFLVASPAFQNALANPLAHPETLGAYQQLLAGTVEVAAFDPSEDRPGPALRVYQVVR